MTSPVLAALFDFNISPHMIAIVVPIAGMIFGGVMAISALYFRLQRKRLWHETARLALEKGQPLPAELAAEDRPPLRNRRHRDLRTGLILIGVSSGIFVFLRSVGAGEAAAIAAIPGFIGLGLFIFGLISLFTEAKSPENTDRSRPL